MLYRDFGKTGWKVSAVGLGTWNLGGQWGPMDEETALRIIHRAIDTGMNLIDTAEAYGTQHGLSEIRLGRALGGRRHLAYIVSKIGHYGARSGQRVPKTTPDMIRLCGHAILGRLHTDWVDVVLCHEGDIKDPTVYLLGFDELVREGHVRCYGISTNSLDVLKNFDSASGGKCAVVEVDYSLLNLAPEKDILPYCRERGIAVLVRGPLAMGLLSGRYDSSTRFTDEVRSAWHDNGPRQAKLEQQLAKVEKLKRLVKPGQEMATTAVRFSFSHPAMPVSIPGATKPEQVVANAAAGERELTESERAALVAAVQ
jgi:aryl-alcohol dehydrogenase-like predicted oxidoreductase